MGRSLHRLKNVLGFTVYTLAVSVVLLIAAEVIVRGVTDVGRLGTSSNLFLHEGGVYRNTPSVEAVAFGVDVATDQRGFRVALDGAEASPGTGRLLVIGDSVGFGVGVAHPDIATSVVDRALPETGVDNSSVIGYSTWDYWRVAREVLSRDGHGIGAIALIFCLNDVSEASARNIQNVATTKFLPPAGLVPTNVVAGLRANPVVRQLNDLLRAYSSLYVWVRGELTRPRERHWHSLKALYNTLVASQREAVFEPMARIADLARAQNVSMHVWIVPYAWQMSDLESGRMPQDLVLAGLDERGIAAFDLLDLFRAADEPEKLFLPYDPVHLSARGHALLAEHMLGLLRATPD